MGNSIIAQILLVIQPLILLSGLILYFIKKKKSWLIMTVVGLIGTIILTYIMWQKTQAGSPF